MNRNDKVFAYCMATLLFGAMFIFACGKGNSSKPYHAPFGTTINLPTTAIITSDGSAGIFHGTILVTDNLTPPNPLNDIGLDLIYNVTDVSGDNTAASPPSLSNHINTNRFGSADFTVTFPDCWFGTIQLIASSGAVAAVGDKTNGEITVSPVTDATTIDFTVSPSSFNSVTDLPVTVFLTVIIGPATGAAYSIVGSDGFSASGVTDINTGVATQSYTIAGGVTKGETITYVVSTLSQTLGGCNIIVKKTATITVN